MAQRVFLHVGCPKTGTSFLQGVVWSNRAALRQQGLAVPASMRHHYRATLFIRQVWSKRSTGAAIAADWEHLVSLVRRSNKDVLITHELLGPASAAQASLAIETLGGLETHVIITARDMARQLPASWQQGVKHGGTRHLQDFLHEVVERGPNARWFWRAQDLVDVARRWGGSLPAGNVHFVTVPPKAADSAVLWSRFASVIDIDPDTVDLDQARRNESLGRVEVELLRQINEVRVKRSEVITDQRWFKDTLAKQILAQRTEAVKGISLPETIHEWIRQTSHDTVDAISQQGYDVVGDLADLIPSEQPNTGGPGPAKTDPSDLLLTAEETIVDLMDVHRRAVKDNNRLTGLTESQQRTIERLRRELEGERADTAAP